MSSRQVTPGAGQSARDRIVATAAQLTSEHGWARVTMGKLAELVGVSRQTVYNEVGGKPHLAEAMILAELASFLDAVNAAFDREPDDVVKALRAATYDVLVLAHDNALLKAVVSASHGADTELLPLLTTHSDTLLETAKGVVNRRLTDYDIPLTTDELAGAVDIVVRVVLSHVMQPTADPAKTADSLAWISSRVLSPPP